MGLLTLLFPPKCMFCGKLIDEGRICPDCERKLPRCGRVETHGEFFSRCVAPLYYTENVRRAVLAYKFNGKRSYAAGFSALLAETIMEELPGEYDVVTWAPASRRRVHKRGYDQARLLAEETAKRLGMKAVSTLKKIRHTKANSTLKGRESRAANVSGVYKVMDPARVRGKRVLLIDDIVTTGATLSECSRMLLMAGAEDVVCAALAAARNVKNTKK